MVRPSEHAYEPECRITKKKKIKSLCSPLFRLTEVIRSPI